MNPISEQLRDACNTIRDKYMPLSDMIPMMQRASDSFDAKDAKIANLESEIITDENKAAMVRLELHNLKLRSSNIESMCLGYQNERVEFLSEIEKLQKDISILSVYAFSMMDTRDLPEDAQELALDVSKNLFPHLLDENKEDIYLPEFIITKLRQSIDRYNKV